MSQVWIVELRPPNQAQLSRQALERKLDLLIESVPGVGLRLNVPGPAQVIAADAA